MVRRIVAVGLMTAGFLGVAGLPRPGRRSTSCHPGSLSPPGKARSASTSRDRRHCQPGQSDRSPQARHRRKRLRHAGRKGPRRPLLRPAGAARQPARLHTLPPPGEHPNTKRYSVMVVGGGYHGILTSELHANPWARLARRHRADGGRPAGRAFAADPLRGRCEPPRISARSTPGSRACTTTAGGWSSPSCSRSWRWPPSRRARLHLAGLQP